MLGKESTVKKTWFGIVLSSILHEPFAALYPMLPFILIKDLGASSFQIVLFVMLKPLASIFSFYWSEKLSEKRHSLRTNLIGSGLLARLPLLCALFFDNAWLLILASTLYMLYLRAGIPAWMEMLKINLPDRLRERYFSIGSMIGYAEGVLIAVAMGTFLDHSTDAWKILYFIALSLGIVGVLVQASIPVQEKGPPIPIVKKTRSVWRQFTEPWINCFLLMRKRSDFRRFQWAFMMSGFGLMIIQPVIPIFFAETLKLSYRDLMIAYTICKGLGFVLSSPLWNRAISKIPINLFTSLIHIGFALFPFLIVFSLYSHLWLYLAYVVYGVAQAGSHLIWHLSGPIFANREQSARFTSVNVMMVGIRGTVGPPLGGVLASVFGPLSVLFLSVIFGLTAMFPMLLNAPKRLYKSS